MRILVSSDLHGHQPLYDDLARLVAEQQPDAVVLAGDLAPTDPARSSNEADVASQREWLTTRFRAWCEPIAKRARILATMGNLDWAANLDVLEKLDQEGLLVSLYHREVDLGEPPLRVVALPYMPISPFRWKDWEMFDLPGQASPAARLDGYRSIPGGEVLRVDLAKDKDSIEVQVDHVTADEDPERLVLVSHAPPFDTALDRIHDGTPVGSKALRAWIDENQPLLVLSGHIHESPDVSNAWSQLLGRTFCVNCGQRPPRVPVHAALIDVDGARRQVVDARAFGV